MDEKRTKIGPTGPVRAATPHDARISHPPPGADPLLGQTLADRYLIVRKLGEGGMGAVYLATHKVLEKNVALKVLHGELGRKPELVERFMQEARAASRIRHENVIDISDFGATPEGLVFFAMELLNGHDLHEEIARARLAGQLLPWSRSKRIFLQICGALSAAHRHGIVHRDMKPENVYLVEFLGDPDFVKLLDFGIAKVTEVETGDRKLTRTGMLFGTPEYMSPEQARGEQIDHRVDIYAMGCILFQLVTGRVPFEADNFMGVLHQHLTEVPPHIPTEVLDRIGAPRELAAVIDRALAKDRAHRFQSIDELGNAVRVVCGEAPLAPGTTGPITAQRVPGVLAPAETGQRAAPVSAESMPPAGTPSGRVRTQWTGNLSVPVAEDPPPPRRRSKLPLAIAGAIVLAGGAAAGVAIATRGGDRTEPVTGPASGAPVTSGPAVAPPVTPEAPAAPPAPPAPQEAPLPEKVTVTLDSKPRGAIVKDLISGVVFGPTPRKFPVTPSHKPRQYRLTLRGYAEAQIELVPDREAIAHTETLVKDPAARPVGREPGAPQIKPPPDDDCPELPCLKSDPTRKGRGGSGRP